MPEQAEWELRKFGSRVTLSGPASSGRPYAMILYPMELLTLLNFLRQNEEALMKEAGYDLPSSPEFHNGE